MANILVKLQHACIEQGVCVCVCVTSPVPLMITRSIYRAHELSVPGSGWIIWRQHSSLNLYFKGEVWIDFRFGNIWNEPLSAQSLGLQVDKVNGTFRFYLFQNIQWLCRHVEKRTLDHKIFNINPRMHT
jgi:hypothetical protein